MPAAQDGDWISILLGVLDGLLDVSIIPWERDQAWEHLMVNLMCRRCILHIVGIVGLSSDRINSKRELEPGKVLDSFHLLSK
jgi:hypothetical protein